MAFEGYTSATSVLPGQEIDFHLNADAQSDFTVEISRVSRAAPVVTTAVGHVDPQQTRVHAAETGAGWAPAFSLAVPAGWTSGIYRAKFTAGPNETRIAFVVRPQEPGTTSPILLQTCTTTELAYNAWQGGNLYPSPGSPNAAARSRQVSLDHPVIPPEPQPQPFQYYREEQFLLWMEGQGLSAEVCTGIDLHAGLVTLERYALLLSVGHDEYWSREMRDAVEAFIAAGGNVAFFSGNVCWWQVRFEDDNRTMVCYKSAYEDPLTGVDDSRVTVNWYDAPVNRPENSMTGVGFRNGAGRWAGGVDAAYTMVFPQHWVFDGTGLQEGQEFAANCVGYEADGAQLCQVDGVPAATGRDGTPPGFQVLATADLATWAQFGQPGTATMGVYQRKGTVFTAATTDWTNGLGDDIVSRITQNVVERLSNVKRPVLWEQVGHALNVTAMCGLYWWADLGPSSGRLLFAATSDDKLWRRTPTLVNVSWDPIGEANGVVAMAGLDARLYAITADGGFWRRTAQDNVPWTQFGSAPDGAVALAAMEGSLYAATGDGTLFEAAAPARDAQPAGLGWKSIGTPGAVVAMTAMAGRLAGVSADGGLLSLSLARLDAWQEVGQAPGMTALAAMDGRLFGADGGGRLWMRPPIT
jgi:hypothetical protein